MPKSYRYVVFKLSVSMLEYERKLFCADYFDLLERR